MEMVLDDAAPVVQALDGAGAHRDHHSASYATDAGWFQRLELDCVLFGPGSIGVAHKPNEYVPRAHLDEARQVLDLMIDRLCKAA